MNLKRTEAKVTVAKLIELAYSQDKGLTARIMAKIGKAKLTVDQHGNAKLSGVGGSVSFNGSEILRTVDARIKRVTISFSNVDGVNVDYTATFDLQFFTLSVSGDFNVEELITSCTGLLCKAARALRGRHHAYERQLQKIMGQ